jgi:hypothetical protein
MAAHGRCWSTLRGHCGPSRLTPGHGDDRKPVRQRTTGLRGHRLGDRGHRSPAVPETLGAQGVALLTTLRKNMPKRLMRLWDTRLRRTQSRIDPIHEPWQHLSQSEHPRPRSVTGCMITGVAGLAAYRDRPNQPALGRRRGPLVPMLVVWCR